MEKAVIDSLRVQCPHCQQKSELVAELLDQTVQCPNCHNEFVVKSQVSSAPIEILPDHGQVEELGVLFAKIQIVLPGVLLLALVVLGLLLGAAYAENPLYPILGLFSLAIYMIPSLIATTRKHVSFTEIFYINIFAGWTVIGWILCLGWSLTADVRKPNQFFRKTRN